MAAAVGSLGASAGERAQLLQDKARLAAVELPGGTGVPVNLLTLYFRLLALDGGSGGGDGTAGSAIHGDIEWLHLLDPEVTSGAMDAFGLPEAFQDLVAASIVQPSHARRRVRRRLAGIGRGGGGGGAELWAIGRRPRAKGPPALSRRTALSGGGSGSHRS